VPFFLDNRVFRKHGNFIVGTEDLRGLEHPWFPASLASAKTFFVDEEKLVVCLVLCARTPQQRPRVGDKRLLQKYPPLQQPVNQPCSHAALSYPAALEYALATSMPLQSLATSMPRTSTALASSLRHACGLLFATALPMSRFFFGKKRHVQKRKKNQ
jgi:hypothetical protein